MLVTFCSFLFVQLAWAGCNSSTLHDARGNTLVEQSAEASIYTEVQTRSNRSTIRLAADSVRQVFEPSLGELEGDQDFLVEQVTACRWVVAVSRALCLKGGVIQVCRWMTQVAALKQRGIGVIWVIMSEPQVQSLRQGEAVSGAPATGTDMGSQFLLMAGAQMQDLYQPAIAEAGLVSCFLGCSLLTLRDAASCQELAEVIEAQCARGVFLLLEVSDGALRNSENNEQMTQTSFKVAQLCQANLLVNLVGAEEQPFVRRVKHLPYLEPKITTVGSSDSHCLLPARCPHFGTWIVQGAQEDILLELADGSGAGLVLR